MVSAPFATNNTVTKGTKLPENRTVIRKLSFAPRSRAALSLTIAAQFLRCRRCSSLVTAVRFSNGQEALSIVYSSSKYTRFPPKIAAMQKSLFRVVENSKFLNRLRNVHLEKSVATGICRVQRSPKTAKTPLKVHLRLRFQNLGKPRTAGLCGRAAGACDCGPLSCAFIERPSPLEKPSCKVRLFANRHSREYRQKVTVTTLFQTVSHRDFQLLSQTAHVCLHPRKRVHTRLSEKDRTQGHTRRNRGDSDGGAITTLGLFHTFRKPCVARG